MSFRARDALTPLYLLPPLPPLPPPPLQLHLLHHIHKDIGVPAQAQLDVTLARKEAGKTAAGLALLEEAASASAAASSGTGEASGAGRARTRSASPAKQGGSGGGGSGAGASRTGAGRGQGQGQGGHGAEGAENDDAYLAAEEDAMRGALVYPRGTLLLELEDGFLYPSSSDAGSGGDGRNGRPSGSGSGSASGNGTQRVINVDDDVEEEVALVPLDGTGREGADARPRMTRVQAVEMERIPDLAMGKTQLGCKVSSRRTAH